MELMRSSSEAAKALRMFATTEVPIFAVLESQMGDPVLSHWIGKDGIVAGTALGRISAYLFERKPPAGSGIVAAANLQENGNNKPSQAGPIDNGTHRSSLPAFIKSKFSEGKSKSNKRSANSSLNGCSESSGTSSDGVKSDVVIELSNKSDDDDEDYNDGVTKASQLDPNVGALKRIALLCYRIIDYTKCGVRPPKKANIDDLFPGRYTVFASFSDEAVRAVFIHGRMLYAMIGTSSIAVYDVDEYLLKNEYRLSLSRNTGYKQITFAKCKILVDCMRGSTILDPVERKQISSSHRVYPSNVLDFNGSEMLCYYRNINKYFVHVVSLDMDSSKKVTFSIAMPKSVYLVTHGKFWNPGRLVVVTDMLNISVFKYQEMSVVSAKRKMRVDIVAICGGFKNFLVVLSKDSVLKLLHHNTLNTFFRISVFPATFELGWPYTLLNHKSVLSFTSDEGVYCLKIPKQILQVATQWRKDDEDTTKSTGDIEQP